MIAKFSSGVTKQQIHVNKDRLFRLSTARKSVTDKTTEIRTKREGNAYNKIHCCNEFKEGSEVKKLEKLEGTQTVKAF